MMMQALLVSQDSEELAVLAFVLQRAGFSALRSVDLDRALEKWGSTPLDLIMVSYEVHVPLEQINRLRGLTDIPLIIIVDNTSESLQLALLEAGVDKVVNRPFSARLLSAEIRALMRRAAGMPLATLPTLNVENITLDPVTRTVQIGDDISKRLTHLEFRLLYTMMIHKGQVVPTETLVERVWGYAGDKDRDLARGLVRRLRTKIEPNPKSPRYLVTIPGVGYVFMPSDEGM
ncbi:MAG: response regulator transcription factor [Anaerolineae bacterium]|nr:response regulator transcription factor [Anaerolineae bacterium]